VTSRTRPAPNQTNAGTTVTTNYATDALHRTTAISYTDGATPSSTFQYDQTSVSQQNPQNPSGRLTYETSANGDWNGKISHALKCVVFFVEARMRPTATPQFGDRDAYVVPRHFGCVAQVRPAG
jgi:hypothetical protein